MVSFTTCIIRTDVTPNMFCSSSVISPHIDVLTHPASIKFDQNGGKPRVCDNSAIVFYKYLLLY